MKRVDDISKKHSRMSLISCNKHCSNLYEAPKWTQFLDHVFLDRIDIQIEIVPVPFEKISDTRKSESSAAIRERVIAARNIQEERFADEPGIYCNAQMSAKHLDRYAEIDDKCRSLLQNAMNRFDLSARAYERIIKISRTIADLAGRESITVQDISEAVLFRNLDRSTWQKIG